MNAGRNLRYVRWRLAKGSVKDEAGRVDDGRKERNAGQKLRTESVKCRVMDILRKR